MRNRWSSIWMVALLVLLSDCKEPFGFSTQAYYGGLVIDGVIDDGPGPWYVNIGTTVSAERKQAPVQGAVVSVTTGNNVAEALHEIEPGKYQLDGGLVRGIPGQSYTLDVLVQDKHYRSTAEVMPTGGMATDDPKFEVLAKRVVSPENVSVVYWYVDVILNTTLANSTGKYRWGIDEVYSIYPTCPPGAIECPKICYVFQPTSRYNLFLADAANYSNPKLENILIQQRDIDDTFNARHVFNITQYLMNEQAYQYWQRAQELILKKGSIFDTPPARLRGNITNINNPDEYAFGYFEASRTTISRVKVDRGYIPITMPNCDYNPNSPPYFSYCGFCLVVEGARLERPDWF